MNASRSSFAFRAMTWLAVIAGFVVFYGASHAQKIAIIAISPELGVTDRLWSLPRVSYEADYLRAAGYQVRLMPGTRDNITLALANPQVRALAYFGHAARPSLEHIDATGWKNIVYQHLYRTYRQQGLRDNDARHFAGAEVQNFGLELMRNHSCSSLTDDTLARQFVRPGGIYAGARSGAYQPCPTPWMLLSNVQFFLDDYRVPGVPPVLPQVVTECERGSSNICGTWTLQSANSYHAQWQNGASASLSIDRFDATWVILSRYDTSGVSSGLSAVYIGRRNNNQVTNGQVTWSWQGRSWTGTWNANWGQQAPTGRGGGA